ncbi:MAG: peroxiredoxin [Deltaproteobacteria bacterium HGW-Deltaproteobacteria-8]|jgi:peroxiredoxin (alkyl hydroperoxide reductase subunit C)|nr:MAG: peroxiredoxin [Deltaproteobacteria bacterium HGW-Deltaproteobacteria-8]
MKKFSTLVLAAALIWVAPILVSVLAPAPAFAIDLKDMIYDPGQLKPVDSTLKVRPGQMAPDFALPSTTGAVVRLSDYRGKMNVVLSFVPAAFTPVCSDQWPGYKLTREMFEERDAMILGITVDNVPSLYAWVVEMHGLWFPVLSDFQPRGAVAKKYGLLRTSGTTERAIVIIDKKGVIRFAKAFDINRRPDLGVIMGELDKLQ